MAIVEMILLNDAVDPEAIDVWIDGWVGDEPVRFRLDTGASRCAVPSLDSTRQLDVTGVNAGVGLSGTGLADDEVVVPQLRIGDLVIEDVAATRSPTESALSPLLGMTALGRYRCDFRFSARSVQLYDSDGLKEGEWFELASYVGGQPIVPVHFDNVATLACWDTGAGLTAVDLGFADAHPYLFEPLRNACGIDGSGIEMSSQLARMAACRIGGVAFGASYCALVDLGPLNAALQQPMSFVLGMPAIVQADWCFDFPRCRWSVRRPDSNRGISPAAPSTSL